MQWLVVALGGSLGAVSRYALALLLPYTPGKFPLSTFVVNITGSFLIGVFFVVIIEKAALPIVWRQALMVGLLGAFTTFSTFSMESFQLLHTGHWKTAVFYVTFSVVACVFAAFLGYTLVNKLI